MRCLASLPLEENVPLGGVEETVTNCFTTPTPHHLPSSARKNQIISSRSSWGTSGLAAAPSTLWSMSLLLVEMFLGCEQTSLESPVVLLASQVLASKQTTPATADSVSWPRFAFPPCPKHQGSSPVLGQQEPELKLIVAVNAITISGD